jgi:hypothetical protein
MLSDAIVTLIIGTASALVGLLCKLTYSSKCTKVRCGCIEINRDTANEAPVNLSNSTPSIPTNQNMV